MNDNHAQDRICRNCGHAYTPQCKGIKNCPRHPKRYTPDGRGEDWG